MGSEVSDIDFDHVESVLEESARELVREYNGDAELDEEVIVTELKELFIMGADEHSSQVSTPSFESVVSRSIEELEAGMFGSLIVFADRHAEFGSEAARLVERISEHRNSRVEPEWYRGES